MKILSETQELIKQHWDNNFDIDNLPLNDPDTFSLLCHGKTVGVFQLASTEAVRLLNNLRPDKFNELIDVVAINRPSTLKTGKDKEYRKNKEFGTPEHQHPLVSQILKDSHYTLLYQDQIMRLAHEIGGLSLCEADTLRSALKDGQKKDGKKDEVSSYRQKFIAGALAKETMSTEEAEKFFDNEIAPFNDYSYPKAHSAIYAWIVYVTAYLKAHYPQAYFTALLNNSKDNEQQQEYLNEGMKLSITILPPDINGSMKENSLTTSDGKKAIRLGLNYVLGQKSTQHLLEERKKGPFLSYFDFYHRLMKPDKETKRRCLINRTQALQLIKAGAFDELGNRHLSHLTACLRKRHYPLYLLLLGKSNIADYDLKKKVVLELESLSVGVSGNPLEVYDKEIKQLTHTTIASILRAPHNKSLVIGGIIQQTQGKRDKRGREMATALISDKTASIGVVLFADVFKKEKEQWCDKEKKNRLVVVKGRVNRYCGQVSFVVEKVRYLL